jgi:hypothetical protein
VASIRPSAPASPDRSSPLWLRLCFWFSILIAVAVVIRRLVALTHPSTSGPPELAGMDAAFASHAGLTLAHIIPAMAFVLVAPFVFLRQFAGANWPRRLIYPLGAVVGLTAYAMSRYSIGGWTERSAVLLFDSLFLFCLARAFWKGRSSDAFLERQWLTRAIGILLGIATTRPVMGVFFATSRLTHWTPSQFFGIAFWIGFSLNTVAVELWLRSKGYQLLSRRRFVAAEG